MALSWVPRSPRLSTPPTVQLTIDKRFALSVSPEQAWAVLCDARSVGACMPGARIEEVLDARRCRGALESEVGPARVQLAGVVEMAGRDDAQREVHLVGEGVGTDGTRATMDVLARIEATGFADECRLVGRATIEVAGALEVLGQRVLGPASDAVLSVFARNFAAAASTVPSLHRGGAAAAARGAAPQAGPESTLTLFVQGGQAPGAAVAPHTDGAPRDAGEEPKPAGKGGALRDRLRGWFGAGKRGQ